MLLGDAEGLSEGTADGTPVGSRLGAKDGDIEGSVVAQLLQMARCMPSDARLAQLHISDYV